MTAFPTSGHLYVRAGMAPGNHLCAGKRQGGFTEQQPNWALQTLGSSGRMPDRGVYGSITFATPVLEPSCGGEREQHEGGRHVVV